MPRVSIVHHSDVVRALVGEILSAEGFEPIGADTVEDALALMWVDPPALAVVDEHLIGGVGGLPALPVPWIALGRRGHGATLAAAGACCVVQKPFVPVDLVRAVAWALEVYGSAPPGAHASDATRAQPRFRQARRMSIVRSGQGSTRTTSNVPRVST